MFHDSVDTKLEAQSDIVVVAPKPVEIAEVVWVHPQSKLVSIWMLTYVTVRTTTSLVHTFKFAML